MNNERSKVTNQDKSRKKLLIFILFGTNKNLEHFEIVIKK